MDFYVARQPIFDRRQQVYAYELLYRSGSANLYTGLDGDKASSEVITNSFILMGPETLTRGRKAFINFTRNLLENQVATLLPKELLVVEILENIEPDEGLLNACRKLKEMGYTLALDDFVYEEKYRPFIELADIIKIDFLQTTGDERRRVMDLAGKPNIKFLAEKVETRADFNEAVKLGYAYFQGYFFEKPLVLTGKDIPTFQHTLVQLMQETNKKDCDVGRIEEIIKTDVSLSYKLLKFINSVSFGFRSEIRSIKQALMLLGQKELMKWVTLVTLRTLGDNKPDELLITAVSRAYFFELMATIVGMKDRSSDLFLMGLLSLIDVFLEQPLTKVLEDLPVDREIKQALLGQEGKFRELYELMVAFERGEWDVLREKIKVLSVDERSVAENYIKSLESANRAMV
ncbi:MAG: EAL and HDOD domain-containing protein [Solirubrobacterales bacterium]